ncbi:MAG: DUF5666 domain-containing protein [Myxococcales bacterium]
MQIHSWKLLPFALALAACGTSSGGARLEGMLDPASLSDARGQPVQVSVTGTSRATATDASGRFDFDDLAPGEATLRFHGHGFNATVRISGLQPGQTLQITVRLGANGCVVRGARANEIALVGAIGGIAASSITVSGLEVDVAPGTRIGDRDAPLALADLRVGDAMRVEGTLQAGGKVLAREIERVASPGSNEVLLRGTIGSLDATAGKLTVSDLTIATDASTRFTGAAGFADLKLGDRGLVQGTLVAGGAVLARLVCRLPVAAAQRDEVEIEGPISSIAAPDRFQVAGKTVVIDSSTRFEGEHDRPLTFADLKLGDRVEVEGTAQADGTILARKIERDEEEEERD